MGERLFLQESTTGQGGSATFTIQGRVLAGATIDLPKGAGFTVQGFFGNVAPAATTILTVGNITNGILSIGGGAARSTITVGEMNNGTLEIGREVADSTSITITTVLGASHVDIGNPGVERWLRFVGFQFFEHGEFCDVWRKPKWPRA